MGDNTLLFWMSLIPFATAYLGQNCHERLAVGVYGAVMVCASGGFLLLQTALARQQPDDAAHQLLFRRLNHKALTSMASYAAAVGLAFWSVYASFAIFVIFPLLYFWPEHKVSPAYKRDWALNQEFASPTGNSGLQCTAEAGLRW